MLNRLLSQILIWSWAILKHKELKTNTNVYDIMWLIEGDQSSKGLLKLYHRKHHCSMNSAMTWHKLLTDIIHSAEVRMRIPFSTFDQKQTGGFQGAGALSSLQVRNYCVPVEATWNPQKPAFWRRLFWRIQGLPPFKPNYRKPGL